MAEQEKPRPMTLDDWNRIQQGQRDAAEARAQALLTLGKELNEDRSNWVTLYPLKKEGVLGTWRPADKFLSLPIDELPFMAQAYINMVETERTNRLCRCEWIIHPDDVGKAEGTRRVHKGAEAPNCPVHTKLGFLLYFFDHYFRSECPACPPDCKSCLFTRDCECYEHGNVYEEEGPSSPTSSMETVELPTNAALHSKAISDAARTQDVTAVAVEIQPTKCDWCPKPSVTKWREGQGTGHSESVFACEDHKRFRDDD